MSNRGRLKPSFTIEGRRIDDILWRHTLESGITVSAFLVDADDWELDLADTREFFAKFGGRLPSALRDEYQGVIRRFEKSMPAP